MPNRQMRLAPVTPDSVVGALAALRAEIGLPPMFPADVLDETRIAAERTIAVDPDGGPDGLTRQDRRDLELVTIDPPGSLDLDQAVHVARSGDGYIVRYAIADLAAFVDPDGALDAEVHRRGLTVYGPDTSTPLHPKTLSEGAASLLPGEDRPAALWTIGLDSRGELTTATVVRALVRNRERLTYAEAQAALDDGTASEPLRLLAVVGRLRLERERERGGVSLDVPEQEVERGEDGSFALQFRRNLPVEGWNAQISLLTGMAAATMMREAGVGVLRTLPEADERDLARLRRTARALRIDWPDAVPYADLVPGLDSRVPQQAAFLNEATTLFRGAGYVAFGQPGQDGSGPVPVPADTRHHAIAADYAHVTAPLRRLVDRYTTEICLSLAAGTQVPGWVLSALPSLPGEMAGAGRRAAQFERAVVEIVEATILAGRVGEEFEGVIVDVDDGGSQGTVVLAEPAVRADVVGRDLPLGEPVLVRLSVADVDAHKVEFVLGGDDAARSPGAEHVPDRAPEPQAEPVAPDQPAATEVPGGTAGPPGADTMKLIPDQVAASPAGSGPVPPSQEWIRAR
ncbi:RNB domain-containing ribonuclease [Myceligenerans indicum]|uniref:RNB domain-containing ribonuclease n=1 Tax=Myceligenerans indicum TaxID=2593663 RepID=A0ABS1LN21_9MICO|nr:RNB domain-containing ribonuclease [Myceligenerans indicum]MBL0887624.1 RNB domain-containing ribonuclease [Myceligenerans indicum]